MRLNNKYQLIIEDNRTGKSDNIDDSQTLGLEIVVALINQINGTIETTSDE